MQYFQEITEASSEGKFVFFKGGESKYIFSISVLKCKIPALQWIISHRDTTNYRTEAYQWEAMVVPQNHILYIYIKLTITEGPKINSAWIAVWTCLIFFIIYLFSVNPNTASLQKTQLYPSALQCLFLSLLGASYKHVIISSMQLSVVCVFFFSFHSKVP